MPNPYAMKLLASIFWLGLALGFTGAVADFLQAQHPGPIAARDVTR